MRNFYYMESSHDQARTTLGLAAVDSMVERTQYLSKTDFGSFLEPGDDVYLWDTVPDPSAVGDAVKGRHAGQVNPENGFFIPMLQSVARYGGVPEEIA